MPLKKWCTFLLHANSSCRAHSPSWISAAHFYQLIKHYLQLSMQVRRKKVSFVLLFYSSLIYQNDIQVFSFMVFCPLEMLSKLELKSSETFLTWWKAWQILDIVTPHSLTALALLPASTVFVTLCARDIICMILNVAWLGFSHTAKTLGVMRSNSTSKSAHKHARTLYPNEGH